MTAFLETTDQETLRKDDVRALVRLLGEVAEIDARPAVRKKHLMEGLCVLVDADVWFWNVVRLESNGAFGGVEVLHGGLDERQIALYFESNYNGKDSYPEVENLLQLMRNGEPFSRRRQQLVPDDAIYANERASFYRRELDMDQCLYTFYPLFGEFWSCVALHRRWGRPAFTARQSRLAHIVLSEIDWLHRVSLPGSDTKRIPLLPRRLRVVLGLLLEGQGRQQIADHLGLSEYTVRDYMSQIYRHFGVRSQVELMRRLAIGDGKDGGTSPA